MTVSRCTVGEGGVWHLPHGQGVKETWWLQPGYKEVKLRVMSDCCSLSEPKCKLKCWDCCLCADTRAPLFQGQTEDCPCRTNHLSVL